MLSSPWALTLLMCLVKAHLHCQGAKKSKYVAVHIDDRIHSIHLDNIDNNIGARHTYNYLDQGMICVLWDGFGINMLRDSSRMNGF